MARRLYVTRQAISRWEQGTTEPGIDMLKLIARELDVPVTALLDMPEHYCQSCGMMFTGPDQHGHEADGSETEDFCRWCYDGGAYTYETTMDEMIEDCAPRMAEAMGWTVDEAASLLGAVLPTLRRWREVAENEKAYGEETRAAYGDEVVDASNKKYLAMGEAAHLQAEELAVAINEQLRRAMEAGDPAGPRRASSWRCTPAGCTCTGRMVPTRPRLTRVWRTAMLPTSGSKPITKRLRRGRRSSCATRSARARNRLAWLSFGLPASVHVGNGWYRITL